MLIFYLTLFLQQEQRHQLPTENGKQRQNCITLTLSVSSDPLALWKV